MQTKQQLLIQLLRNGEGERLDYKQTISNFSKIARTIAAFANTSGGIILIGVTDRRLIVHIDVEEEKYMINKAASEYCDPPVPTRFEELPDFESETIVLAVHVLESTIAPHAVITESKAPGWYIRIGDKSIEIEEEAMALMMKRKSAAQANYLETYEQLLIVHLKNHDKVNLKSFIKLCQITRIQAQASIAKLALNGIIKVHDMGNEDFYSL